MNELNNISSNPNPHLLLTNIVNNEIKWVTKNTAILVVHGIGFQLPLETLDLFGKGLIKQYKQTFGDDIVLSHEIVLKPDGTNGSWFDNVLRISKNGSSFYIDIYEYYWANYTEDMASWNDLTKWLHGVVKGANNFYKRNGQFGKIYKDRSFFFNSRNFIPWRYRFFLTTISQAFFIFDQIVKMLIWVFNHIPFVGRIAANIVESYTNSITENLVNLLVDVVAYNVVDPKNKFYCIRDKISDGAIKSLQYLLEKTNKIGDVNCPKNVKQILVEFTEEEDRKNKFKDIELSYPSVIVAAHSLGTQIAYDAINQLNLMINKEKICTYNKGECVLGKNNSIKEQLCGFITFGSPLDKVVFFLRENIPDEDFIRQQLLDDFHGFKQREINTLFNNPKTNKSYIRAKCGLKKFFEDVKWNNYYDDKDYVSGGLDYYKGLTNINCQFKANKYGFTHSYYWKCDKFYVDIIDKFLN